MSFRKTLGDSFKKEQKRSSRSVAEKKDVCGILPTGFCLRNSAPAIYQRIVEMGKNDGPGRNASTT